MLLMVMTLAVGTGLLLLPFWGWASLIIVVSAIVASGLAINSYLGYRDMILVPIVMIFGYVNAAWHVGFFHPWRLPEALISKSIPVVGVIESISHQQRYRAQFVLLTDHINHQLQHKRLRLSWYGYHPPIEQRSRWQFTVRLKPAHGLHDPGGFDYQHWLWLQGIVATGYVVNHHDNRQLQMASLWPWQRWRQRIYTVINANIKSPVLAAVLAALTVGRRDGFNQTMWQVLRRTGTSHLVAISGLHLGLLVGVGFTVLRALFGCWPRLLLYCPAVRLAAVGSLVIAWFYAAIAGFAVPTERALLMISLVMLSYVLNRSTPVWRRLLFAAGVILLIQPLALFGPSFWLSFSACVWMMYGLLGWQVQRQRWRQWLRVQWVLFLGLMPLTLFFFQQISLSMMLANVIAIPWIGCMVLPLGFIASVLSLYWPAFGAALFHFDATLLSPLWQGLQWLAQFPALQWHQPIVKPWILPASMLGMFLLLAPRYFRGRWLGVCWLLPLYSYHLPGPAAGSLWLTLLDVTQGEALVLRTANHTLLYQAGLAATAGFDANTDIVLPYLRWQHIYPVDRIISSNSHFPGALLALSKPYTQYDCRAGQQWDWDGWHFQVLSPFKNMHPANTPISHHVCVLQIRRGSYQLLLTGEIGAATERQLLKRYGSALRSNILVVPYYGSSNVSSMAWVKTVSPDYALFSASYLNRFHYPSAVVVARYQAVGAQILSTAKRGAIQLHIQEK